MYKWCYALDELIKLYEYKTKKYVYTTSQHYNFLIELAKAVHGAGSGNEVGKVTKEDIKGLPEDKQAAMKHMLGADYGSIIGK